MKHLLKELQDTVSGYTGHTDGDIRSLARSHVLRQDLIRDVVTALDLPDKSCGLDMGCGIGLPAFVMVACRPDLTICGMDLSEKKIRAAEDIARTTGMDPTFKQGSALAPDFADETFDWVFSMDCLNYVPGLGEKALVKGKGLLKKGGKMALLAWSCQQILPGFPMLEAKLNATGQGIAPFQKGMNPDRHFNRTPRLLSRLGFINIKSAVFVQTITGPLDPDRTLAVRDLIRMRWPSDPGHLSADERLVFAKIAEPGSNDDVLADPHYFGFFTYTLFTAEH